MCNLVWKWMFQGVFWNCTVNQMFGISGSTRFWPLGVSAGQQRNQWHCLYRGPSLRQHQYLRLNRCSVNHSQSHCLVPEQHVCSLFALCFCHKIFFFFREFIVSMFSLIHLSTLIIYRPWSCLWSTNLKKMHISAEQEICMSTKGTKHKHITTKEFSDSSCFVFTVWYQLSLQAKWMWNKTHHQGSP